MLTQALKAEVDADFASSPRNAMSTAIVILGNDSAQLREILTAAGTLEMTASRATSGTTLETGGRQRFFSAIPLPCVQGPQVTEVLSPLYPHDLSNGNFVPTLEQFLKSSAELSVRRQISLHDSRPRQVKQRRDNRDEIPGLLGFSQQGHLQRSGV
ncbi:hypothetical protein ACQPYK_48505 (plasmid) [Streptosporangium sp. CA-135522]|uniref:hypothetical protein n=1 Tax=Streptosporangium sp. CA-135522 TaxID=3240072 RepID=UPI003D94B0AF